NTWGKAELVPVFSREAAEVLGGEDMTLMEFFDGETMDNVLGTLMLQPETTVFLWDERSAEQFARRFENLLRRRGVRTRFLCERINTANVSSAYEKIEECIMKYSDCDFDITGGAETAIAAVGMAADRYGVPLHTIDAASGRAVSAKGKEYKVKKPFLTVREMIELHGGEVREGKRDDEARLWRRNEDAERDIEKVWEVCRSDCGAWNAALGTAAGYRADKRGVMSLIWQKLRAADIVKRGENGVRYKNKLAAYLLGRQGTALEMHTFAAAKSAVDKAGKPFFDDGESGIELLWKDGRCVVNEMDVFLTRGAVGYFISCKNGSVTSDELYKLDVVSRRFGGRFAKKALVLSYFEPDKSFMERADELGIKVIKNARSMSKRALAKRLTEA
ncbi:MAG: DUF1887 family CARF protein, partial [Clostridia bacterium]|nr:DUF1887 family CARF protein [Clostridia bacterium]